MTESWRALTVNGSAAYVSETKKTLKA